jgi:putative flippase GtrA
MRHDLLTIPIAQLLRFVLCSGAAAMVNLVCGAALLAVVRPGTEGYVVILASSYCIGMAVNFGLNRHFTFPTRLRAIGDEARTFLVVSLTGLGLTVLIGWLARSVAHRLVSALGLTATANVTYLTNVSAQAFTIAVVGVYSFTSHRALTFSLGIRSVVRRMWGVRMGHDEPVARPPPS